MSKPKNIKELKKALPKWHVSTMTAGQGRVWIVWCTQPKIQVDENRYAIDANSIQVGVKLTTPNIKRKREAIAAVYASANSIKSMK